MREQWTGDLVGKMHNAYITNDMLAKKLNVTKGYVSMILTGSRNPPDAKERLTYAVEQLIAEKGNIKIQGGKL